MNKKAIWAVVIVIVVVIVAMLAGRQSKPETVGQASTIKIGAVLGLTGYAATDSLNVKRGIDLAVADLGARGVNVEVSYQDDKTDPKQTVSAIQYLVSTYKPQAIIGPIWSFLEDAATPAIAQSKLVAYAPADTSEFTTGSPYIFHGAVKNAKIEQPAADWLKANKAKNVAIIVSKDGWGLSVEAPFKKAVQDAGGKVILDDALLSDSNVTTVIATDLAKAKSLKADAIMFTGYDEAATILAKKRGELSLQVPVLVHSQIYPQLLSSGTVTKDQMNGMYVLETTNSPEFAAKFQAKYGVAPGNYADRAYDGVMLLVNGIQNAATSSDALAHSLRTGSYKGYAATYSFDEKGDLTTGEWKAVPIVQ